MDTTTKHSDLVVKLRISYKGFVGLYLLLVASAALIWWLGFTLLGHRLAAAVIIAMGLAPLIVGFVNTWLVRISTEYRLFQDSLEVESGIISRRIENIQL